MKLSCSLAIVWCYVYDFGSGTDLVVRLLGNVTSAPFLRARSDWRLAMRRRRGPVMGVGKPRPPYVRSAWTKGKGFFCATHASDHDCGAGMLLPVVNSPRMGVCGYTGEA